MKRVVSSSFITLLIIVAVAATFFYLKNYRNKGGNAILAIPADVSFLFAYDPASATNADLLAMDMWKSLRKAPAFEKLHSQLTYFDSTIKSNSGFQEFFTGQPLYLTAHVTGAGVFDFLFLKSLDNGFNELSTDEMVKSLLPSTQEINKRNYDGNIIREISLENNKVFSFAIAKGIFIGSFTSFLVEDALRQLKVGKPVITEQLLLDKLESKENTGLFICFKNLPPFITLFLDPVQQQSGESIKNFGEWAIADLHPKNHKIQFSGLVTDAGSNQFVNCMKGQQPVEKKMIQILPRKTAVLKYYGFSDFKSYYSKLNNGYFSAEQKERKMQLMQSTLKNYSLKLEEKMVDWIGNEMALVITEPSGLSFENNSYAVFSTNNEASAKKALNTISRIVDKKTGTVTMEELYNGHNIGFIRLTGVIPALFGETFNKITKLYYTDINSYIVFANQASAIRTFIDDYESGLLLYKTDFFKDTYSAFPEKGNQFLYIRPSLAMPVLKSLSNNEWKSTLDTYKNMVSDISTAGYQISACDTGICLSGIINFFSSGSTEGVNQIFAVETDTSITMKPLATTDPVSHTRQFVFQDNDSNIYLCDNSGNILWKQKVNGKAIGNIFEIDLFRNNTRQFLFNTSEYIYLIDVQGNLVGNYPIRLPAKATNGISVFDFDKNKDVKIYVACENKNVYAYLSSGKPLPGWNMQPMPEIIERPVQTINVNGKDMLIITDRAGQLRVVNRYGEPGIIVSNDFSQAANSTVFKNKSGNLITTDPSGNLVEIMMDGTIQTTPLHTGTGEHYFLYDEGKNNEPDFFVAEGKTLTAYNKDLSVSYKKEFEGNITGNISLHLLQNNEKVLGIFSSEADKTWLIKKDGTVYSGFPVKGSTPVLIDELNMDGKKQLITGSHENLIHVYSLE